MLTLLIPLLACAQTPAEPPKPVDGPKVSTLLGDAPGITYLGDWTSKGCPSRSFPRNIHFEQGGTYAGIDLVSPCPVGTQCAWSGIVSYQGIWMQQGQTIELRDIGGTGERGPHPTSFRADDKGFLVESGCNYERGVTIPDGYTADAVTPKVVQ
jgi:hypothetical protein